MPFANFDSFESCKIHMMEKEGYDEETAKKVCGKLQGEHEGTMSLSSTLDEKPVREGRDLVIPFVKDGTLAFDSKGKKYTLTAEALQKDHLTWNGGKITINHKVMSEGKISEVFYKAPFVYGRITGLTDEVLNVIDSAAYRGVSQESTPVSIDKDGNVVSLKGTGLTVVVFPENPACPLRDGCGTIKNDFSLNTENRNSSIKSIGGTEGKIMTEEQDGAATALKSITAERDALKAQLDALTAEMTKLKSTTSDPDRRIATLEKTIEQMTSNNAMTIKSALDEHRKKIDAEVEQKKEFDMVVSELRSVMKKDVLEVILKGKPTLEVLKSNLEMLKMSGLATHVGAGIGTNLTSTQEQKIRGDLQKMNIPSIEFVGEAR